MLRGRKPKAEIGPTRPILTPSVRGGLRVLLDKVPAAWAVESPGVGDAMRWVAGYLKWYDQPKLAAARRKAAKTAKDWRAKHASPARRKANADSQRDRRRKLKETTHAP